MYWHAHVCVHVHRDLKPFHSSSARDISFSIILSLFLCYLKNSKFCFPRQFLSLMRYFTVFSFSSKAQIFSEKLFQWQLCVCHFQPQCACPIFSSWTLNKLGSPPRVMALRNIGKLHHYPFYLFIFFFLQPSLLVYHTCGLIKVSCRIFHPE